jgi:hypothetical protein
MFEPFISSILATCPASLTVLGLITLILFGEGCSKIVISMALFEEWAERDASS